jgi:L-fucose mutarotase
MGSLMLKGIDPLLSGALLHALDELGHGQTVVVVDRNFPAYESGKPVVRVDSDAASAVQAILTVFPLDPDFGVARMQVADDPSVVFPQAKRVLELADESTGEWEAIPRFEFYDRAATVALVVLTRESEPYANFIFTKGVVN